MRYETKTYVSWKHSLKRFRRPSAESRNCTLLRAGPPIHSTQKGWHAVYLWFLCLLGRTAQGPLMGEGQLIEEMEKGREMAQKANETIQKELVGV